MPGRGLLMGNRGTLHDATRRIVRAAQVQRWIACVTAFRGRVRTIHQPGRGWTELFFLDEAAAFSAGHRPCGECRNADYKRFRALWEARSGTPAGADVIDLQLHAERRDGTAKRTYRAAIVSLPDGAYIERDGAAWLLWNGELLRWSDAAYTARIPRPVDGDVTVLTPPSIVAIIASGYVPGVHPSASAS